MRRVVSYLIILLVPVLLTAQEKPDSVMHSTREFGFSNDFSELVPLDLDTTITNFYRHRINDDTTPFYISMGNYGLEVMEMDFFRRSVDPGEYLYRNFKPYMHYPGNIRFVNTQVPFTQFDFTYGKPRPTAEQTLSVRHSQNVNKYLNFGINLDAILSQGQYLMQKSDDKAFTFHGSYTGKQYEVLGAWSNNKFSNLQNGGVNNIRDLSQFETRDVPVKLGELNKAETGLRNNNVLLVQRFTLGAKKEVAADSIMKSRQGSGVKGTFSHILTWENNRRTYSDQQPSSGFYDTAYITRPPDNNVPTFDSLYSRVLRNTLRFDFTTSETAKFRLGIGVGILNELNVYSQIIPTLDSLYSDTVRYNNSSNAITGKLYNRIGEKFGWEAFGTLWFSGYRSGDMNINGRIFKKFGKGSDPAGIYARGRFEGITPSWWLSKWGSNHFIWNNDFKKEMYLNIGGGVDVPARLFDMSIDYALVSNMIYFDGNALPAQSAGAVSVLALRVNKVFRLWKFRSSNNILVQKSSNAAVVELPMASVRSSFYLNHTFHFRSTGGVLEFQAGAEAVYYTPFHSPGYIPSTGIFYNQDAILSGNYPYLNAFANLKIKRTRIFVSYEHLNGGMMGYDYFIVPGYPMAVKIFKYGFSWTFYN